MERCVPSTVPGLENSKSLWLRIKYITIYSFFLRIVNMHNNESENFRKNLQAFANKIHSGAKKFLAFYFARYFDCCYCKNFKKKMLIKIITLCNLLEMCIVAFCLKTLK